jgi:hypothetical protein
MLARHPKTGAPIRILKSDSSLWRDQKTLVWFDAGTVKDFTAAHSRFETGVVGLEAAKALAAAAAKPNILLSINDSASAVKAWLETGAWQSYMMVCFSRATIQDIGVEFFSRLSMRNLVCLDELHQVYPFLGPAWTEGSVEDAKVIIAMVLHMGRTGPVDLTAIDEKRKEVVRSLTAGRLELSSALLNPSPLVLVTQYYSPTQAKRRKEIQACLQANVACSLIDRVVLLNEKDAGPLGVQDPLGKISQEVIGHRLTYADVLRWICLSTDLPADALVAFANADIFFDDGPEGIRLLWSVDLATEPAKFLALLRWEVQGTDAASIAAATIFGPRADSQDTWIVSAAAVRRIFADCSNWTPFEIPFGQAGCDNAITVEMLRKKFQVVNPAVNMKTYHYHTSQIRNYDPKDIVDRPAYLHIDPTGVHDMQPIIRLGKSSIKTARERTPHTSTGSNLLQNGGSCHGRCRDLAALWRKSLGTSCPAPL